MSGHDENAASRACVQETVQHTALVAFHLQLLFLPLGGTSFFQARPERRISTIKPPLPILMPPSVFTSRWNGAQRSFPHALPEQISESESAASPHAWKTQQHHSWHALLLGFRAKPFNRWGCQQIRNLESYNRDSPSLCNITLRYPTRRNRDTNHDVAYSLIPFYRRQVAAYFPVFISFATKLSSLSLFVVVVIVSFCAINLQTEERACDVARCGQSEDVCPLGIGADDVGPSRCVVTHRRNVLHRVVGSCACQQCCG